jgi:uncharacterized membrane-anchored protein
VTNFAVNFDTSKIKISLSGGLVADVANIFVWIFKNSIIQTIGKSINTSVPPAVRAII